MDLQGVGDGNLTIRRQSDEKIKAAICANDSSQDTDPLIAKDFAKSLHVLVNPGDAVRIFSNVFLQMLQQAHQHHSLSR